MAVLTGLAGVSVDGGRIGTGFGSVRMLNLTVLLRHGGVGELGNGLLAMVVLVVLVVVVVGLGVLLIRDNPTFSRLDELEHFNYITSLTDRHRIPQPGEQYTQSAMRAQACHGAQVGGQLLQR